MNNININRLNWVLSPAQLAAIKNALDTIESTLSLCVGLTPEQRRSLPKLGPGNLPFVEDVNTFIENGVNYLPRYMEVAEFEKDLKLYNQLDSFSAKLEELSRLVLDTQMLAGHESLVAALRFYENAKLAQQDGQRGVQAVIDRLSTRFDGQGKFRNPEDNPDENSESPPTD